MNNANKHHLSRRVRILAYLVGVPTIAYIYSMGLLLLRGWDWYGSPNPIVEYTVQIFRGVFGVILFWPAIAFSCVLPPSIRHWKSGFGTVAITGVLMGFLITWLVLRRLAKRKDTYFQLRNATNGAGHNEPVPGLRD